MTTYEMCKFLIENNKYETNNLKEKLDLFLLGNRITNKEYEELISLIDNK